jgi:EAL domain-containing protein (putative c-di-GMP-specific phosphodiesterase class I)
MVEIDGSVTTAAHFMPAVEDLGMIRPIDRMVLEAGIKVLSDNPTARMALNVSGLTATDRSWMRGAVTLLRHKPNVAGRLMIEITETAGLEDVDACARFVATLRDLGCQVALDDFGAGYTSFRHLKQLAVNMVKIDGSFIRNLTENPDNLYFIRTLVDLARNFGLETVAECVETEEDARILANEGIDYLQGYAFGKPEFDVVWPEDPANQSIPIAIYPGATSATS